MRRFLGLIAAYLIAPSIAFAAMDATVPADNEAIGLGASRIREVKAYVLRQYVDVVDKGADPTGLTDSSVAIQAAIDSLSSTYGGIVFVPVGQFLVHNIEIRKGVRIIGVNKGSLGNLGASHLINNSATGEPTLYNTSTTGVPGMEIEHIRFSRTAGSVSGHFIDLSRPQGVHIHHCHFQGWTAGKAAIHTDGAVISTIDHNQFYWGAGDTTSFGILMDNATGYGNSDNTIGPRNAMSAVWTGLKIDTGTHNLIHENDWEDGTASPFTMKYAVYITGGAENILRENRVEMGINDATSACFLLNDTSWNVIRDNHLSALQIGVMIQNTSYTSKFNRLYDGTFACGARPVWIKAGVEDTLLWLILPTYVSGGSDVLDQGTRTVRSRLSFGQGLAGASPLTGTGIWNFGGAGLVSAQIRTGSAFVIKDDAQILTTKSSGDPGLLGVLSVANCVGVLTISNMTAGRVAQYELQGGINAVTELIDPAAQYTPTKDNAGTINIYYDAGGVDGAGYYIQNKNAASRTLHVTFQGF